LASPFEEDLLQYAASRCQAIEFWLTKLEAYIGDAGVGLALDRIRSSGITPAAASLQGGLLDSHGPGRQEAWDLFARRLELCRQLEIPLLVVACDVSMPLSQELIEHVRGSLAELARWAGRRQMRVALEFQARSTLGNNLQTAVALVEEVGSPHLGLCLDAFHFFVGPSKLSDLDYLEPSNLFHVQLCDLADTPRECARDSDRILPGDGDIPLGAIVQRLREINYQGFVAAELMNQQLWQVPARQFGEIGMTALRKTLGQASME
jgi:4-hydroxyphenylpyruvate dioxygenase